MTERAPLVVDVPEAGRLLGVSPRSAWRLVRSGEVPSVRIGGSRRVLVADIDRYLADLREGVDDRRRGLAVIGGRGGRSGGHHPRSAY